MGFIASAILSPLCKRLINTALQEYELARDVKEEVGKLRFTVSLIQEVLQDAEQKQVKEEFVRYWLRSLKQLLYDAEDILDEAATDSALETIRRPENGASWSVNSIFSFGSIDQIWSRRDLAHQIKHIRMKLDEICKEKDALGLQELLITSDEDICPAAVNTKRRRPDTSSLLMADKPRIVGRDDEKRKIMQMLMGSELETSTSEPTSSNSNNVRVLSLVGMGGVGKTTLAKLVFSDPTVEQHFHVMMWVCVSENFDVQRITKEILEVISPDQQKESFEILMNLDSSQRRLKAKIEGKKFLLVLDDVWVVDPSNWESLCGPLTYGGKGSRIIVTTRNQKVSNMVKASCVPLKSLSDEDLWPILKSYAFDGGSESQQLLESIGRQIVKKLKGSPLAAKTIGRLLNRSLDVRDWKDIIDSEIFMLEQDPNDISPVLKLSYDHLPGHLKQCFAYCSLFPKDYEFSRSELAQHWVAHNFIQTPMGDHHFDDLLGMSFFEESMYESKYVMHDLIHDLAESISEGDCLRLGDGVQPNEFPEAIRHVSIATEHLDPMKLKGLCKHGKLRTLHFLSQRRFHLSPLLLDNLFTKLKRLRVLGLRNCGISELPTSIGKLKHLRFVDFSYTDISELPKSLCGLHNLQVLRLKGCSRLRALPGNMSALVNLMHLEVSYHSNELVSSIQDLGKLTALQELNIRGVKAKELGDMSMLRHLRIRNLEQVTGKEEATQARLDAKKNLETLRLGWEYGRAGHRSLDDHGTLEEGVLEGLQPAYSITELIIRNYGGVRSPRWLEDPSWVSSSFLERVELRDCKNWEVLPPLGQLRGLKYLEISGMSSVRQIDPLFFLGGCYSPRKGGGGGFEMLGFPSLESLYFGWMREWEEWEAPHHGDDDDEGQQQQISFLPRLHTLEISHCPKLKELPPLPRSLKSLNIRHAGLTRLRRTGGCCGGSAGQDADHMSLSELSQLCIDDCPNLRSLDDDDGLLQHPLPRLSRLSIRDCRELTSLLDTAFAHFISLKRLVIINCPKLSSSSSSSSLPSVSTADEANMPLSMEEVDIIDGGDMVEYLLVASILPKLTCLSKLSVSVGSSSTAQLLLNSILQCQPLTATLRTLEIRRDHHRHQQHQACSSSSNIPSLIVPPASPPLEMEKVVVGPTNNIQDHLTSLTSLTIGNCSDLPQLSGLPSSLKGLFIYGDTHLDDRILATYLQGLCHLRSLHIEGCPHITSLPTAEVLCHLTALQALRIRDCRELMSWGGGVHNLIALQNLYIVECPKLQWLPFESPWNVRINRSSIPTRH